MHRLFALLITLTVWLSVAAPANAVNATLVPCHESPAFQERMKNAPNTYYFDKPFQSYSSELLCGSDGLPHLPLDRVDRTIDVVIPFAIFFYVAGFIGWSGRTYLQLSNRRENPEQFEIFIDPAIALRALTQGLLWPLLFIKEFLSGDLTAEDGEISVSPR